MKTNFNFNLFAVLLSLLLLDLATLHPAEEPGADYAAQPAPVASARPPLRTAQLRRPVVVHPRHRVTAAMRRP